MFTWAPLTMLLLLLGFAALLGLTLVFGGMGYQPQHARGKQPPSHQRPRSRGRDVDRGGFAGRAT
jgi:hypothetical protein